MQSLNIKQMQT